MLHSIHRRFPFARHTSRAGAECGVPAVRSDLLFRCHNLNLLPRLYDRRTQSSLQTLADEVRSRLDNLKNANDRAALWSCGAPISGHESLIGAAVAGEMTRQIIAFFQNRERALEQDVDQFLERVVLLVEFDAQAIAGPLLALAGTVLA